MNILFQENSFFLLFHWKKGSVIFAKRDDKVCLKLLMRPRHNNTVTQTSNRQGQKATPGLGNCPVCIF